MSGRGWSLARAGYSQRGLGGPAGSSEAHTGGLQEQGLLEMETASQETEGYPGQCPSFDVGPGFKLSQHYACLRQISEALWASPFLPVKGKWCYLPVREVFSEITCRRSWHVIGAQ